MGNVLITAAPHPFQAAREIRQAPEGMTLAQMLAFVQADELLRRHAVIQINGVPIPRPNWHVTRPKAGTHVEVRIVPHGGGGGGKNVLRTVLLIAVVAASFALGGPLASTAAFASFGAAVGIGGAALTGLATSLIGITGMLLVNAIAPVRPPKTGRSQDDPIFSIAGSRNSARPFEAVPAVLGRHRIAPAYGAAPFTEIVGSDQYLRLLFVWGIGPLHIDTATLKIGETPITEFDGVELEHRPGRADDAPLTLYPDTVTEDPLNVELTQAGSWVSRTGAPDADELSIDLSFPIGLVKQTDSGNLSSVIVALQIEFREVGAPSWSVPSFTAMTVPAGWVSGNQVTITAKSRTPVRHGLTWRVPSRAQYEVRVRRVTEDRADDKRVSDQSWWTVLRTITDDDPVRSRVPVAKTAMRIKATGQLNGVIDEFTGVVTTIGKDWDGSAWIDDQQITNPASLFRHVLQGNAIGIQVPDSRIDLPALQSWHGFCAAKGFTCNIVQASQSSVWEVLADVAGTGRAAPATPDGKWGVVVEQERTIAVSHITPRNSFGFSAEKAFVELPHAWRIPFPNAEQDWRPDERRVYRTGFDASNATRFEELSLPGVTDPVQVQRLGRFRLAQAEQQPERWQFGQDVEYLTYQRGDRIAITHDVLLIGLASGRVKSVTVDGSGNVTAITLDEPVEMAPDKAHGIAIRNIRNAHLTTGVLNNPGPTAVVVPVAPIPPASGQPAVAAGDVFGFGILGQETEDASVVAIEPEGDYRARITAVPYRAAIFNADTEPVPPFDTNLTPITAIPPPTVQAVTSDESVLGFGPGESLRVRVAVALAPFNDPEFERPEIDVQFRYSDVGGPFISPLVEQAGQELVIFSGVQEGQEIDIRVRFRVAGRAVPGPWATVFNHRVAGRLAPPAGLSGLTLSTFGGQAYLRWDRPPEIDVQFGGTVRFRHSPEFIGATWSASTSIGEAALARDLKATLPLKPGTYLARVFDVGGTPSADIASVTTKQASVLAFAAATSIDEDPTFSGTHVNTTVSGGKLMLGGVALIDSFPDWDAIGDDFDAAGQQTALAGTYTFAAGFDFGSVVRRRLTSRIGATVVNPADTIDSRMTPIDEWESIDGDNQGEADAWVEIRLTDDDPSGSPTWGAWNRLDSAEVEARGVQARVQLVTRDAGINIEVADLGIDAEALA